MAGAFVVAHARSRVGASQSTTARALLGDVLALAGAATAACYVVAGRRLRATLDLWPYVAIVYGSCFVVLLVFAAIVARAGARTAAARAGDLPRSRDRPDAPRPHRAELGAQAICPRTSST